jgi:hypothetical protein
MKSSGDEWCKHYGGTAYPGSCKAGMDYDAVKDDSQKPRRWACTSPECRHLCPKFEEWTQEEIDAQNAAVSEYINRMTQFSSGESRNCPTCNAPVEGVKIYEKIDPETFSLYVQPCNCRLGLWSAVPAWIRENNLPIEVVPSEL